MTQGLTDPARVTPEAIGVQSQVPLRVRQITWSSPLTNRLLLDAGYGGTYSEGGNPERIPNPTRNLIRVVEQCANGCAANGDIPGLNYRSQDWGENLAGSYPWRASAAYVTGAHSLKVGYQGTFLIERSVVVHERSESDLPLQQRRAEPAYPIDLAVDQPLTCRIPRVLRPGTVDVPPPHVAGGAPVRQGHQLVPGTTGRTVQIRAGGDRAFPRRKASTATRTSRRGWVWRTTCSETARPRSSSTSASTSRASPCSSITSTRIPSCGCPARRVCSERRA